MSKFFKKFGTILVLAAMLGGCKEEMPSLGEASSTETTSGTVTETSAATTAVPAKEDKETSTVTSEKSETTAEHDEISDEQAALEKLILDTAENKEEYTIQSTLFGDFDGDGVNELIAEYGEQNWNELWFASCSRAYKLEEEDNPKDVPFIQKSAGNVFITVKHYYPGTFGAPINQCNYYIIKNSSASKVKGETAENLVPDGNYGDFTGGITTSVEFFDQEMERTVLLGYIDFWYYFYDGDIHQYYSKEITREEFLKYDGAAEALDKIVADGCKVTNIFKRSNGIININHTIYSESGEGIGNTTVKYRQGKIFQSEEYNLNYGNYDDTYEYLQAKQTDFERFSEMIYDAAEGDENSFIRERFYGDTDKDGKNELYAYYGTDENFSLWFADENGAKKVTEDISLFYADGDVLMKNGDDYFVIKKGKQKKLDTMGAEEFSVQADGSFTGYVSAGYTDSTRSEETRKLYWFRYRDGKISEYTGTDITEEELLQYGGGRAALDEVAARGGDLVNIVRRENGIININYALHNQNTTQRFFMTLEIGTDNKLTDITPKKEDGTPDNAGWYLHSLKIGG